MKKDIFIDNNIACRFANPMDPEMKKLINWIMKNEEGSEDNAILVVSDKLLHEYIASCQGANGSTSIPMIVGKLTKEGRLLKISNAEIQGVSAQVFYEEGRKVSSFQSGRQEPYSCGSSF